MTVGSDYDPMLSKVIAHGADRLSALRTLDRALADTAVLGVGTNVDFLRFVLSDSDVIAGRLDTGLLERLEFSPSDTDTDDEAVIAAAVYRWLQRWPSGAADPWDVPSGWRLGEPAATAIRLRYRHRVEHVRITGSPGRAHVRLGEGPSRSLTAESADGALWLTIDGIRHRYLVAGIAAEIWIAGDGRTRMLEELLAEPVRPDDEHSGDAELLSPMPGSVVAVGVGDGDQIVAGTTVVAVEAMKMEHALRSPVDGVVELLVAVGDQVKVGQPLARIKANTEGT
jgi:acetyl-CoA/propionyl-CoA carboxylase biotin carboxyl carrier protein